MRPPARSGSCPRPNYFAFFCRASKLVSKTVHENFVHLRQHAAKGSAGAAETAASHADEMAKYITKVRRHASQPDAKELARIVFSWERNGALGDEGERSTVRIVSKMHHNHCHYLKVSAMAAASAACESGPAADAARASAPAGVRKGCDWGARTLRREPAPGHGPRAQLVLLFAETDIDVGRGLDLSVLWPVTRWDWTPEIDSFFEGE